MCVYVWVSLCGFLLSHALFQLELAGAFSPDQVNQIMVVSRKLPRRDIRRRCESCLLLRSVCAHCRALVL